MGDPCQGRHRRLRRPTAKFWPMYDLLYTHQDNLEPGYYGDYAAKAGLSEAQFKAAFQAGQGASQMKADTAFADALNIEETPTILLRDNRAKKVTVYVGTVGTKTRRRLGCSIPAFKRWQTSRRGRSEILSTRQREKRRKKRPASQRRKKRPALNVPVYCRMKAEAAECKNYATRSFSLVAAIRSHAVFGILSLNSRPALSRAAGRFSRRLFLHCVHFFRNHRELNQRVGAEGRRHSDVYRVASSPPAQCARCAACCGADRTSATARRDTLPSRH